MPHLAYVHKIWKEHVRHGDFLVDATAGKGYDTCFLATLLAGTGKLTAYDVQEEALRQTRQRLEQELSPLERGVVELKWASHAPITEQNLALVVYNLGYLPGGDKQRTTYVDSTLLSVTSTLQAIKPNGLISIMCYPGHPEGAREEAALLAWGASLPSSLWEVRHHRWINRGERSPSLLLIRYL